VLSTWDIRENIPFLQSLRFVEPLSDAWWLGHDSTPIPDGVAAVAASCTEIRIALHHTLFTALRYPIDAAEVPDDRMLFEFSLNAPDVRKSTHALATFLGLRGRGNIPWNVSCAVSTRVIDTGSRISSRATIAPSFMAEVLAARFCDRSDEGAIALIGKRTDVWDVFVLDGNNSLLWMNSVHDDGTLDYPIQARELLLELRTAVDADITTVMLYGDGVTKNVLAACSEGMFGLVHKVVRMNPFARVGADTDDATKRICIQHAHMLGPIVGQVLSPSWPAFPCASSAAR